MRLAARVNPYERNTVTTFEDLGLQAKLLKAVASEGYSTPTPIQAQAIPHLLEGRDLLGIAQTGTGKTAAFALPTLDYLLEEHLARRPRSARVLALAPTRELAAQIAANFGIYSKHMDCVVQTVFGGVNINRQIQAMKKGADVLVATPGRLLDLMEQGAVRLDDVEILILDEADQMLDLGFAPAIKKIMAKVPHDRQTILLSATMPSQIADLAARYLDDPVHVSVSPQSSTAERVTQRVIHVATHAKPKMLEALLREETIERALIFTRTKHGADKVASKLAAGGIEAGVIHGGKSQPQRLRALKDFRDGRSKVLVATDIAARGIDIDGISHIINFELPNVAEQYVHRIGRTARAGREGVAISLVAEDELYYLREIEKIIRSELELIAAPAGCEAIALPEPSRDVRPPKPKGSSGRGGRATAPRQEPRPRPKAKPSRRRGKKQARAPKAAAMS